MHSRIFQLSEHPISEDDYLHEMDFIDNGFCDTIADYVDSDTNREEDIDWFVSSFNGLIKYDEEKQTVKFPEGFQQEFFRDRFDLFKKESSKITLDEFASNLGSIYFIEKCVKEKFGFYIWHVENGYPEPLDDFIRSLTVNTPYYIGKTIDYHW